MENKPLQLIKRPNLILTKGQKSLYELICLKIPANKPITYEEAKEIYITKVPHTMVNGQLATYNPWYERNETGWNGKYIPLNDEQVKFAVLNWLTINIGRLVVKGALKIIPQIELT